MAPAGLILTVALKVFLMDDTSLIVRNTTGDCGFSVVQCTTTPDTSDGAIKMEVIQPRPKTPSLGSVSAYDVHLKYEPISMNGEAKYFKVDNMTNRVYLDDERSAEPPFRADAIPFGDDSHIFLFTMNDADKELQMKVKIIKQDCASENSSSADAVKYTDTQDIVMLTRNGGINSHRHIVGHLIEC